MPSLAWVIRSCIGAQKATLILNSTAAIGLPVSCCRELFKTVKREYSDPSTDWKHFWINQHIIFTTFYCIALWAKPSGYL